MEITHPPLWPTTQHTYPFTFLVLPHPSTLHHTLSSAASLLFLECTRGTPASETLLCYSVSGCFSPRYLVGCTSSFRSFLNWALLSKAFPDPTDKFNMPPSLHSLSLIFLHNIYHHVPYILLCLPPLEYKLHEDKCFSFVLQYPQC